MNYPITFTPAQLIATILSICVGISAIGAAIGWIIKAARKIQKPNRDQNKRLDEIEARLRDYALYFKHDKERLDEMDDGSRVTQRAILALLSHGIDGNDVESMKAAKKELTDFLTRR